MVFDGKSWTSMPSLERLSLTLTFKHMALKILSALLPYLVTL